MPDTRAHVYIPSEKDRVCGQHLDADIFPFFLLFLLADELLTVFPKNMKNTDFRSNEVFHDAGTHFSYSHLLEKAF